MRAVNPQIDRFSRRQVRQEAGVCEATMKNYIRQLRVNLGNIFGWTSGQKGLSAAQRQMILQLRHWYLPIDEGGEGLIRKQVEQRLAQLRTEYRRKEHGHESDCDSNRTQAEAS